MTKTDIVEELNSSHVHMKDPQYVDKLIKKMVQDGPEKLQVVADFDRTLSKYSNKGKICSTCHDVLEESKVMPNSCKEKAKALRDKYFPIEVDHSLTIDEKIPKMIEWWTNAHDLMTQFHMTQTDIKEMVEESSAQLRYEKSHELFTQCHMTRDDITDIVSESSACLRDNCQWFIEHLHKLQIPLLIFSAGIGDIIQEVVKQQSNMYDNMKIVSNYMKFDENGKMQGFKGDIIHIYNKNENAIHSSDYFERLNHRDNLLLLGDSLGDLRMAEGAEFTQGLKIGFLNHKVDESLELYKDNFDIVIVEDDSLDIVNAITRKILNLPKSD